MDSACIPEDTHLAGQLQTLERRERVRGGGGINILKGGLGALEGRQRKGTKEVV